MYDNGGEQLPITSGRLCKEVVTQAREVFEVNLQKSRAFYTCALGCRDSCDTAVAAFLLHQAAELVYRAILLSLMGKEVRTHSIKALIKHSRRCAPQLDFVFPRNTPEERQLVHQLEEAYLKARYEAAYSIENAVLGLLFERVWVLLDKSEQVFDRKVTAYAEID